MMTAESLLTPITTPSYLAVMRTFRVCSLCNFQACSAAVSTVVLTADIVSPILVWLTPGNLFLLTAFTQFPHPDGLLFNWTETCLTSFKVSLAWGVLNFTKKKKYVIFFTVSSCHREDCSCDFTVSGTWEGGGWGLFIQLSLSCNMHRIRKRVTTL